LQAIDTQQIIIRPLRQIFLGDPLSPSPFQRPAEVPPEFAFISLPQALAQFHHLPLHVPVWIHRQEEIEKKGYDFGEGARVMEALLLESPGIPGAYLYQLFVRKWPKLMEVNPYFESGRIAEAIPKLVEILDIDPECPLASFQLGYCFRATGELEKSESFYKKALRMAPDAGWIYSNLGRTYLAMGDRPKATEVYLKALELLPGDHFVLEQLIGLGELFLQPGQEGKEGASPIFVRRSDYEKKMRDAMNREKDPENLVKFGWKLLQDRLNDMACQSFEKARTAVHGKGPLEVSLGLGTAHLEAGRYPEAEHFLLEYLDDHPDSATAHLNLFKVYLAREERDLAWDEIQAAVKLDPGRLEALRQLYYLFLQTDRKEEGLEWMDRLALENPSSYAPLLVKAWALTESQKWPEAQETLQEALRRSPHNEEILLFFTSELGKRGQRRELIQQLQNEPPDLPLSLTINLALAYSQEGQLEEGRKVLQDFLKRPQLAPLDQERVKRILKEFGGEP
jgi:tetratricopeptide (TPR) repeat protein